MQHLPGTEARRQTKQGVARPESIRLGESLCDQWRDPQRNSGRKNWKTLHRSEVAGAIRAGVPWRARGNRQRPWRFLPISVCALSDHPRRSIAGGDRHAERSEKQGVSPRPAVKLEHAIAGWNTVCSLLPHDGSLRAPDGEEVNRDRRIQQSCRMRCRRGEGRFAKEIIAPPRRRLPAFPLCASSMLC